MLEIALVGVPTRDLVSSYRNGRRLSADGNGTDLLSLWVFGRTELKRKQKSVKVLGQKEVSR